MFNYDIGTPCPAPVHGGRQVASPLDVNKNKSIFDHAFDQFNDNTTQNIAHLVQQEFKISLGIYRRYEILYCCEQEDGLMTDDDGMAKKWMPRQNQWG